MHAITKTTPSLKALRRELKAAAVPERLGSLTWFKTGKGEYSEHDKFINVSVPKLRSISAKYRLLRLADIESLLASPIHEYRYAALLILVGQYQDADDDAQQALFEFYLQHTRCVNNWDLVDTSAPCIVGAHLVSRSRRVLYHLADSGNLWERRIAMVATSAFIDRGDLKDAFAIAKRLLGDDHDLIHKAIGWMLREAGVQSRAQLMAFLKKNYARLPRTTLRYAIEHLPEPQRKRVLKGVFPTRMGRVQ